MKTHLAVVALAAAAALPSHALKYAAPEHSLQADPSIPSWQPGPVKSEPEEELNIVGADIMDEITLGWMKIYRKGRDGTEVHYFEHNSGKVAFVKHKIK